MKIPQHLIDAINRGDSVHVGGEPITTISRLTQVLKGEGGSLPGQEDTSGSSSDVIALVRERDDARTSAQNAEAERDTLKQERDDARELADAQGKLIEAIMPTTEEGLKALNMKQLKAIATFEKTEIPSGAKEDAVIAAIQDGRKAK